MFATQHHMDLSLDTRKRQRDDPDVSPTSTSFAEHRNVSFDLFLMNSNQEY